MAGTPEPTSGPGRFLVVGLGSQTAGLFQGQEGWCMNYPGENEVFTTDVSTSAMAWFASRAEAERFIDSL